MENQNFKRKDGSRLTVILLNINVKNSDITFCMKATNINRIGQGKFN